MRQLLRPDEVAKLLGFPESSLGKLVIFGVIPTPVKAGTHYTRWFEDEVKQFQKWLADKPNLGLLAQDRHDREKVREAGKREKALASRIKKAYRLTPEEYRLLLKKQKGRCAICRGRPIKKGKLDLCVDHDHGTGKVRGFLCGHCNKGLGCFKDNPRMLRSAIRYLKEHAGKEA